MAKTKKRFVRKVELDDSISDEEHQWHIRLFIAFAFLLYPCLYMSLVQDTGWSLVYLVSPLIIMLIELVLGSFKIYYEEV